MGYDAQYDALYPLAQYLNALSQLESASQYIAAQFHMGMTLAEAKANIDARSLLLRYRVSTHNEAASRFDFGCSPITQRDIDAAIHKKAVA